MPISCLHSFREQGLSTWCSCMSCWCHKEQEQNLKGWPAPTFIGIGPGANLSYPMACVLQTNCSLRCWRAKGSKRGNERGQSSFLPGFYLKKFWRIYVSQTQTAQLQEEMCIERKTTKSCQIHTLIHTTAPKMDLPRRAPSYCLRNCMSQHAAKKRQTAHRHRAVPRMQCVPLEVWDLAPSLPHLTQCSLCPRVAPVPTSASAFVSKAAAHYWMTVFDKDSFLFPKWPA